MKYILFFFAILLLQSCNYADITIQNSQLSSAISSEVSLKTSPLIWNKQTTFTRCSSSDVPKNLEKVVTQLSDSSYTGGIWGVAHFGRFVTEYCATPDGDMIFYSQDKAPTTFGRYNSKQDILEPASFDAQFLPFIYFFDGKKYGFGKRVGTIVPLISAKMEYKHFERDFLRTPFQNKKNEKFCKNGLTSTGKSSECFIEIYYEYDFVKNVVFEKKVCTYWKNTTDNIVPMEKCIVVE